MQDRHLQGQLRSDRRAWCFSSSYIKGVKTILESILDIPSYVAYSEQGEWLIGKIPENHTVYLQNIIYGIIFDENKFIEQI